ncbi:hypothetical protein C8F01DRAFT_1126150 [Mycena amicta]|nr:hypothetical protein C8F01DRAFT_1126150 [Mycena amicta]
MNLKTVALSHTRNTTRIVFCGFSGFATPTPATGLIRPGSLQESDPLAAILWVWIQGVDSMRGDSPLRRRRLATTTRTGGAHIANRCGKDVYRAALQKAIRTVNRCWNCATDAHRQGTAELPLLSLSQCDNWAYKLPSPLSQVASTATATTSGTYSFPLFCVLTEHSVGGNMRTFSNTDHEHPGRLSKADPEKDAAKYDPEVASSAADSDIAAFLQSTTQTYPPSSPEEQVRAAEQDVLIQHIAEEQKTLKDTRMEEAKIELGLYEEGEMVWARRTRMRWSSGNRASSFRAFAQEFSEQLPSEHSLHVFDLNKFELDDNAQLAQLLYDGLRANPQAAYPAHACPVSSQIYVQPRTGS